MADGYFFRKDGKLKFVPYDDYQRGREVYHKIQNSVKNKDTKNEIRNIKKYDDWKTYFAEKYGKYDPFNGIGKWDGEGTPLVEISENFKDVDEKLLSRQLNEFERLREKYEIDSDKGFKFDISDEKYAGKTDGTQIVYNEKLFNDYDAWVEKERESEKSGKHIKVKDESIDVYTTNHEFGHILERQLASKNNLDYDEFNRRFMSEVYDKVSNKTGIVTIEEMNNKYLSNYGKSKEHEDFAETFVKYELGDKDDFTEAFEETLKKYKNKK